MSRDTPKPRTPPGREGAPDGRSSAAETPGRLARFRAQARLALSLVRLEPFDTSTPLGRSNERYRRIALTILSSFAVRGVSSVIGLVTVPLVLGHLGKERFGLWSTITTLIAWVSLFDFGIANGLVNVVSRAHGRDDREEARRYVSTALALLLVIAAALALVVATTAPFVPWSAALAVRGAVDEETVRSSVVAALGVFLVTMPLSVVPQVFAGYQKAYVTNAFLLVGVIAGFGALLFAVRGGAGMPTLVVCFGVGGVLASAMGLGYVFAAMPWLRFRRAAVSRAAMRSLMSRSLPLFLFQLGALAVSETQAIVLAHRCDLAVVAEYSVLMRVYALALGLIQMSTGSFLPSFREAWERGDRGWMRASFVQFLRARMGLAVGACAVLVVAGNPLLRLWLRRSDMDFRPQLWIALAVLMLSTCWVSAHSDLLTIMDRIWVNVGLVLVNGAVTVALTYGLAPAHQVLGAVIATGFVTALFYSWLVPWIARRRVFRADR